MKHIISLGIPLLGIACGREAPSTNYRQKAAYDLTQKSATVVSSVKELPACTDERENQLIFVQETDSFRICLKDSWTSPNSADLDAVGKLAVGMKKIGSSEYDLCSDSTEILCYLAGGELISYADGSAKYNIQVAKKVASLASDPSDSTLSSDISSSSMDHHRSWDGSDLLILPDVSRNSVSSGIWLRFDAKAKQFSILFDTNRDNSVSEGDEVLFQPELVDL